MDLIPVVIEDKYRAKYIEGLKEYREISKTVLLQKLFSEEQEEYAKKVNYFLGKIKRTRKTLIFRAF